jgi:hypothetical protein
MTGHQQQKAAEQQQGAAEAQALQEAQYQAADNQAQIEALQAQVNAQQTAAAQAPVVGPAPDRMAQLKELGELKQAGILSDAEFETEKARILAS